MSSDSANTQPPQKDGANRDSIRALNQAIDDGDADADRFAQVLTTVSNLDAHDASGWRPLKRAIHVGSTAFTEQLLKAGADPNTKSLSDEASALVGAIRKNRADLVGLLLRYGAAPRPVGGESPLNDACAMKSVEMVELLLQAGAAVDGEGGDTPLMTTARAMSPEVARLLLERKPDVKRVDRDGRTALWWAASESPYGCAPVHVVRVDPSENLSPAELAKRFEQPPPPSPQERQRHEAKIVEFVRLLLEHGADPNVADRAGKPPLAMAKCASVAKLLLEGGARVDLRDRNKLGIYDWFALSGIAPDAVGLPPRPQAEPATAMRKERSKRTSPKHRET